MIITALTLSGIWVSAETSPSDATPPNRLLFEQSPYLQQHAYNPVDWFPWGVEAFEKAKTEGKVVLLSIRLTDLPLVSRYESRVVFQPQNIRLPQ
jgi:hypothetical protein